MSDRVIESLRNRLKRDAKKFKDKRELYMYRFGGEFQENILSLPSETKEVHEIVFANWVNSLPADFLKERKGLEVVHIGTFDRKKFIFRSCKHSVLFTVK